jgi:protein-tyrosine phosphatase
VIEIHAHLLPGIDDGPQTVDESLALARAFLDDGVTHVVATPHVFEGRFDNTLQSNQQALSKFQTVLTQEALPLTVTVAGEVRFSEHVIDLYQAQALPFLGQFEGYQTLLLEFPDGEIPFGADKLIHWMIDRKIRPVIAHPERNRAIRDRPQTGLDLVELGCLLQLTAGAVLGQFGVKVQQAAEFLLTANAVAAVSSDAHNLQARAPCLAASRDWLRSVFGEDRAHQLTVAGPAALIAPLGNAQTFPNALDAHQVLH